MRAPTLKAYWYIGVFAGLGGAYGAACDITNSADDPVLNGEIIKGSGVGGASTAGGNTGGGTPVSVSVSASTSVSVSGGTNASGGGGMSAGGGGGMPEQCPEKPGCTPQDAICGAGVCTNGKCVFTEKTLASDVYGDCHKTLCDAQGKVVLVVDDTAPNVYDDGNTCTEDKCAKGMLLSKAVSGSMCALDPVTNKKGICDLNGLCVECLTDEQCKGKPLPQCKAGKCVAPHCSDGMKNKDKDDKETSFDCGGPDCGPCPDQGACVTKTDCQSGVCDSGFCQLPQCTDGVKNGKETDIDCGSVCRTVGRSCANGKRCALPTDCQSGVCKASICQAPNCNDGVQNGDETGIDCGGTCGAVPCLPF